MSKNVSEREVKRLRHRLEAVYGAGFSRVELARVAVQAEIVGSEHQAVSALRYIEGSRDGNVTPTTVERVTRILTYVERPADPAPTPDDNGASGGSVTLDEAHAEALAPEHQDFSDPAIAERIDQIETEARRRLERFQTVAQEFIDAKEEELQSRRDEAIAAQQTAKALQERVDDLEARLGEARRRTRELQGELQAAGGGLTADVTDAVRELVMNYDGDHPGAALKVAQALLRDG